ncbi:hypothetical protein KPATCC21470_7468 [Kitasatospora purpeofusca]
MADPYPSALSMTGSPTPRERTRSSTPTGDTHSPDCRRAHRCPWSAGEAAQEGGDGGQDAEVQQQVRGSADQEAAQGVDLAAAGPAPTATRRGRATASEAAAALPDGLARAAD